MQSEPSHNSERLKKIKSYFCEIGFQDQSYCLNDDNLQDVSKEIYGVLLEREIRIDRQSKTLFFRKNIAEIRKALRVQLLAMKITPLSEIEDVEGRVEGKVLSIIKKPEKWKKRSV